LSSLNSPRENPSEATPAAPCAALVVERADGLRTPLAEGEFRSSAGKLLFVRRGGCIEIRCPRSKELFRIHFCPEPPTGAG
jgi:hypothetical protein